MYFTFEHVEGTFYPDATTFFRVVKGLDVHRFSPVALLSSSSPLLLSFLFLAFLCALGFSVSVHCGCRAFLAVLCCRFLCRRGTFASCDWLFRLANGMDVTNERGP